MASVKSMGACDSHNTEVTFDMECEDVCDTNSDVRVKIEPESEPDGDNIEEDVCITF